MHIPSQLVSFIWNLVIGLRPTCLQGEPFADCCIPNLHSLVNDRNSKSLNVGTKWHPGDLRFDSSTKFPSKSCLIYSCCLFSLAYIMTLKPSYWLSCTCPQWYACMAAGFPAHAHSNMTAQLLAFLHICAVAWLHRGLKQNPKDFSKHFPRGFFLGGNTRLGGWAFEILSGKCSMLSFKDVELIHQGSLSHLMYRPGPCELYFLYLQRYCGYY